MKMEKLYRSAKTRPGADCGSDHQLLIAKFRLKLKKVGKTTRPFRYDGKNTQNCKKKKKNLHDPDNRDDIIMHLESDILEC